MNFSLHRSSKRTLGYVIVSIFISPCAHYGFSAHRLLFVIKHIKLFDILRIDFYDKWWSPTILNISRNLINLNLEMYYQTHSFNS